MAAAAALAAALPCAAAYVRGELVWECGFAPDEAERVGVAGLRFDESGCGADYEPQGGAGGDGDIRFRSPAQDYETKVSVRPDAPLSGMMLVEADVKGLGIGEGVRPWNGAKVMTPFTPAGGKTQVAHRAVSFSVPGPGYYVLEIDGPHGALHLFVEPPRDFPEKEGATYRYGPGMHVAGLVRLKSHDRVYVDRDAIVFGCFIGEGVEDVDIFGHGVIDGRVCERVFEGCYSPLQPSCIRFHHSRGIRIDGPVLMDSPSWTLAFFDCENVETRHVKIVGQWRYNTDGIDICNSRRVTVRDCFVRSFDDTIAVKGVPPLRDRPVEDVAVERCVLWCGWGKTIETGIETWAPRFRNIRYADCDILRSQASSLNVSAGGQAVIEDGVFERNRLRNGNSAIYHDDLVGYWGECGPAHTLVVRDNDIGDMRDVSFDFRVPFAGRAVIDGNRLAGQGADHPFRLGSGVAETLEVK